MVYICFLLYGFVTLKLFDYYRNIKYIDFFLLMPFVFIWVLIVGGQFSVGTDYFTYLDHFINLSYNKILLNKNEYFFIYFIEFCQYIGISGQGCFFIIAFIEVLILIKILYVVFGEKSWHIFFFVFICFSTVFNNQMNAIRQYFSVYIFSLSVVFFLKNNYFLSFILYSICIGIHRSSIFLFLIYLYLIFVQNKFDNKFILVLMVCFGGLLANINIIGFIREVASYIGYDTYATSSYVNIIPLKFKIIKFYYIPYYIYIIFNISKYSLSRFEKKIFNLGVFAFSIKLAMLSLTILNRFSFYFEILMIFPLVIFILKSKGSKDNFVKILLCFSMFTIYMLKVTIFAQREYLYQSIFF